MMPAARVMQATSRVVARVSRPAQRNSSIYLRRDPHSEAPAAQSIKLGARTFKPSAPPSTPDFLLRSEGLTPVVMPSREMVSSHSVYKWGDQKRVAASKRVFYFILIAGVGISVTATAVQRAKWNPE